VSTKLDLLFSNRDITLNVGRSVVCTKLDLVRIILQSIHDLERCTHDTAFSRIHKTCLSTCSGSQDKLEHTGIRQP
jgi:hypothetical protein